MSRPLQLLLAFATVYLVWGSTYLAIRIGVHDAPPILFAALRFLLAAPLMLGYAVWRGDRLPNTRRDWLMIVITGVLMLVVANGLVTWAEQWVASGQAALIIATSALWMAWFGTWGGQGEALSRWSLLSLLLGFAGVAVLVGDGLQGVTAPLSAYVALVVSPIAWAAGSILSRRYPVACGSMMTAALQTMVAAFVMAAVSLVHGDLHQGQWTIATLGALFYLVVFGSCIAYGAYYWLVHAVTPAQLGTYAYINPSVAVLLGWLVLDEHLSATQVLGTAIILCAVLAVTLSSRRRVAS